jgi:hypothetical protein
LRGELKKGIEMGVLGKGEMKSFPFYLIQYMEIGLNSGETI